MSNIYILEYIGTFRPTDGFVQFRPEYWRKRITNEIMLSSVIFKIIFGVVNNLNAPLKVSIGVLEAAVSVS